MPPPYGPPAYAYGPPPWEMERRKRIDRTKTGILLLLFGTLIGWIPVIGGLVGGLLLLIGAILVILGRKAFGRAHSRNVVLSIVLFIAVGIVGGAILFVLFTVALIGAAQTYGVTQDIAAFTRAVESAFNTLLYGVVVVGVIAGLGSVFFTYALQNPTGRILLWSGYGASVAVDVASLALVAPLVAGAVADSIAGGSYNPVPLANLQAQADALSIMSVIPAAIFAAANYIAWSRINRGEIPPPPEAVPPAGGQAPPIHPQ